jgi:histidinol-phosphate aminotransferase
VIPVETIAGLSVQPPPEIPEAAARLSRSQRRLNLNESLLPPSPKALAAMREALDDIQSYPDHACTALRALIAERAGIRPDRISFGNGSGELLTMAATVAVGPGDEAIFPTPTFPTGIKGVDLARGKVIRVPVKADGVNDIDAMLAAVTGATRLFYVCTPNNPTGGAMSEAALARAIREVPDDCLLLVDEAYHEFAVAEGFPDALPLLARRRGPWAVTRSFSKAYCLAGIRVGYVIAGDAGIAQAFWKLRGNFNVSRVASAGALAAFQDTDYLDQVVSAIRQQRERLAEGLRQLGCDVLPSQANFLTARAPLPAQGLADALAAEGLLVQAMPWPDAQGTIRVTIGTPADTAAVLASLGRLLRHSP